MNGFYAVYFTGKAGISMGVFAITETSIAGADVGGLKYDGQIEPLPAGGFKCSVVYDIPPGANLITGAPPPVQNTRVPVQFELPNSALDGTPFLIQTPLGAVNARLEKIRDL